MPADIDERIELWRGGFLPEVTRRRRRLIGGRRLIVRDAYDPGDEVDVRPDPGGVQSYRGKQYGVPRDDQGQADGPGLACL